MPLKRLFDIFVSTVAILILFPLLLSVGALVRIESKGPSLFRQTRIGLRGRPFTLLKFRSMSVHERSDPGFTPGATARVTRVGVWIRRTKVDELPQLWNVLVGDMSLVGPRPEVPEWTKVHPERWRTILSVRPGLTDAASLEFRHEEALLAASKDPESTYRDEILPRKLDLAEAYVRDRSFLGDLTLLFVTARAVLATGTGFHAPDGGESPR
ncbi:MAG: sugar transferase [Planctomycetaceae bacterium]|nr:sugar transferase [Planctomycetaceae bacterium]